MVGLIFPIIEPRLENEPVKSDPVLWCLIGGEGGASYRELPISFEEFELSVE